KLEVSTATKARLARACPDYRPILHKSLLTKNFFGEKPYSPCQFFGFPLIIGGKKPFCRKVPKYRKQRGEK
ncbi:hypothetical protein, partial [Oribacterium sinus]|uniref:hypothetical protein n=1 Tax=Oribacterium sinus TaxID=237576 RepID=UPI0026EED983